jgi:hypothetical protein
MPGTQDGSPGRSHAQPHVGAELDRERSTNNPIGNAWFETIVALDAGNPVTFLPCAVAGNVNLLLGFASGAFN